MTEEYPELDEAMLNSLVDDFESNDNLVVPLPPDSMLSSGDSLSNPVLDSSSLPSFPIETLADLEQEEKELLSKLELTNGDVLVNDDVNNLDLLENVFDKTITEEQVNNEIAKENSKNDSGRLLDKKDVELKTELNDTEIVTISKLRFMADRYNIPVLNDFTNNLMVLKISRQRKGRREFIEGLHADERRETPDQGFFSKMFNKGG